MEARAHVHHLLLDPPDTEVAVFDIVVNKNMRPKFRAARCDRTDGQSTMTYICQRVMQ